MKIQSLPLLLSLLSASLASAFAAPVVSDNFNSHAPGVLPTGNILTWAPPGGSNVIDNDTDLFTRVETDTGNLFGHGAGNRYLRLADTSNTVQTGYNLALNNVTIGQVGTVAFNFYDPTLSGEQGNGGWLLRLGTGAGNGLTAFGLYINNGSLLLATTSNVNPSSTAFATYSLNTLHSLAIVFNSSASAVEYDGRSLAAGKMDVWLNGTIVGSSLDGAGGLAGGVTTIANLNVTRKVHANTAQDFVGTLYMDDLAIYSGIEASAIPEASSFALIGGLGVLFTALLRRRR